MTDLLARILPWIDLHCWIIIWLTHRQLETHGCVVSTVNNYDPLLNNQAKITHRSDEVVIILDKLEKFNIVDIEIIFW